MSMNQYHLRLFNPKKLITDLKPAQLRVSSRTADIVGYTKQCTSLLEEVSTLVKAYGWTLDIRHDIAHLQDQTCLYPEDDSDMGRHEFVFYYTHGEGVLKEVYKILNIHPVTMVLGLRIMEEEKCKQESLQPSSLPA